MKTINIAVWSIGNHSIRNIMPAIKENNFFNLVGIHSRNKHSLVEQSEKYKCKAYFSSADLLSDIEIDVVYICSPNSLHYEQSKVCLLNKKHIIVEKSAFSSFDEATKIFQIANERELFVFEAFMYLYHPQFIALKKLLNSKKYGEILSLEAKFGFPHLDINDIRYSKSLAGGALNDAGAYTVSAILSLLGVNSRLAYSAMNCAPGYNVDTSGIALFDNNKNGNFQRAVCQWEFGASYKNEITVWCQSGCIVLERAFSKPPEFEADIKIYSNGVKVESFHPMKDNHFILMLNFFKDKISNNDYLDENNKILLQSRVLEQIRNSTSL